MENSCFVEGCQESIQFCCECQDPALLICNSHFFRHYNPDLHVPRRIDFEILNAEAKEELKKGLGSLNQSLKFMTAKTLEKQRVKQKKLLEELRKVNKKYQDNLKETYSKYFPIRGFLTKTIEEGRISLSENPALSLDSRSSVTDINIELYKAGFESSEIIDSLIDHASNLKKEGKIDKSLDFYSKALKFKEKISNQFDSSFVDLMNSIADLYAVLGLLIKLKEIETETETEERIERNARITIDELNISFTDLVENALGYYFKAIIIQLKHKIDTDSVNKNVENIENVYFALSEPGSNNSSFLQTSINILRLELGSETRYVALVLLKISDYLYGSNKKEEALAFCNKSAEILENTPEDILYRQTMLKKGVIYTDFDLLKDAKSSFKTCLKLGVKNGDNDKINYIIISFNIAKIYEKLENTKKALSILRDGMKVYERGNQKKDIFYLRNLYLYGLIFKSLERYDEMYFNFKAGLEIQEEELHDTDSLNYAILLNRIAEACDLFGDYSNSKYYYHKLYEHNSRGKKYDFKLLRNDRLEIKLYKSLKFADEDTDLTIFPYEYDKFTMLLITGQTITKLLNIYYEKAALNYFAHYLNEFIELQKELVDLSGCVNTNSSSSVAMLKLYNTFIARLPEYKNEVRTGIAIYAKFQSISFTNQYIATNYLKMNEKLSLKHRDHAEILLEFNLWWTNSFFSNQKLYRKIWKTNYPSKDLAYFHVEIIKMYGKEQTEDRKLLFILFANGVNAYDNRKYEGCYIYFSNCLSYQKKFQVKVEFLSDLYYYYICTCIALRRFDNKVQPLDDCVYLENASIDIKNHEFYYEIAKAYFLRFNFNQALKYYNKAFYFKQANLNSNRLEVADILHGIAMINKSKKAFYYVENSYQIYLKSLGKNHEKTKMLKEDMNLFRENNN